MGSGDGPRSLPFFPSYWEPPRAGFCLLWSPTLGLLGAESGSSLLALQIRDPKVGPGSRLSQFGCPLTGPESSPLLPCSPWITHHPGLCPLHFLRCPKPGAVHGHGNLRNWAEVILTPGLVSLVGVSQLHRQASPSPGSQKFLVTSP